MPFIAESKINFFTKIIVFVQTSVEVEEILEHLQNLHHSLNTNFDRLYNLKLLENTYVTSIEDLSKLNISFEDLKFENLPLNRLPKLTKIKVKEETYKLVRQIVDETEQLYFKETEKKYKEIGDKGACGFANLVTFDSKSEITQALIDLGLAHSFAKGEYIIYLKGYPVQSIVVKEGAIEKAAKYMTENLKQNFYSDTRLD